MRHGSSSPPFNSDIRILAFHGCCNHWGVVTCGMGYGGF